ncbi:hypothetical protein DR64_2151 [Paraburkholderia xenovorans LB400]|nr:hypothetical protein DR64_2151 [Paraburkholderia xenovorans LB400]
MPSRFLTHRFTASGFLKSEDRRMPNRNHIPGNAGIWAFSLLLDESIVRPKTLRVAIAGIHEFDVVSDHAHNAEA